MNTFQFQIAPSLRDFLCNNLTDLNDAVDWVCYTFDLDATDDLIDQIADEFDAFYGNWVTQMTHYNPYVSNLIEMGYDESDCRNVAAVGETNVTYPRNIHGRIFNSKEEYDDAVAEFINGLWNVYT